MVSTYKYRLVNYTAKLSNVGVVITAHNRKNYLLDAIQSAIDQRLPGITYQITVVKNFLDAKIDEFINRNGVNNIFTDKPFLGYKILLGAVLTNSPVICILEDDDLFSENKVSNVYRRFSENKDLVYYHNSMTPLDEDGKKIDKWYKQEKKTVLYKPSPDLKKILRIIRFGAHNLSSITISRNLVLNNFRIFEHSNYGLDYGMLFLAFNSGRSVLSDGEKLTYYRVHDSAINKVCADYTEFINNKRQLFDGEIKTLHNLGKFIDTNNINIVSIYDLMLAQQLLRRSFISFSSFNISLIKYLRLSKYAYNKKNYVKFISLIILQRTKSAKFKNKLIQHYIKDFMLRNLGSKR